MKFKTTFVLWPRRLLTSQEDGADGTFKRVGWVWLQRAVLTKNLYLGWVAFVENQTKDKLEKCPACGRTQ